MLMKLSQVGSWLKAKMANRKGQNTVEYLLMLTVIVGVVLLSGAALKKMMPGLFSKIQEMVTGAAMQGGAP